MVESARMEPPTTPVAASVRIAAPQTAGDLREAGSGESTAPSSMTPALRILVCDHRGEGLDLRLAPLRDAGFALEASTSLRRSLATLEHRTHDAIVLSALARPGTVELSALEHARSAGDPPAVPLLVLASPKDEEAAVRADRLLASGLWDLVHSGTAVQEIAVRLRRLVDLARQERVMRDLRHRASHDDRTDLLRPEAFEKRLVEHFSAAQRHHHEMAFVLIDLDRFGSINKLHDHTVGDSLITSVGEVIRNALRVEDAAGRLGGDEFAVILPYTKKIDAAGVVRRLAEEIKKLSGTPPGAKGPIDVSASIGFETFDGADVDSLKTLRGHAERALRVAKTQGGNRGIYYRSLDE